MTSRVVDEDGNFSKTKIRSLDDRKLGPVEVERIREMWEMRCNRALRKAGLSEGVTRHSLKAQGIDRPATQHLGPKAAAMTRNGCRLRKAETNREIFSASRRMAEIESQLQHLKTHANRNSHKHSARPQIRADAKSNLAATSDPHRSTFKRKTYGVAVRGKSRVTYHGNRPAGNHSRPRLAHSNPARELADLLARGASIGRIAPGHYFRGGQLLVGFLRTLRAVVRILEIKRAAATRIANETVIRSRTIYQALVAPSGLHHLGFVHPKDQSAEPGAVPAAAIGALTMPQDMFRARFFRESLCRLEPIPLPIARFGENSCPPGPIEPIEIEG